MAALLFVLLLVQPPMESSIGRVVPPVVGMSGNEPAACPGIVLASGTVDAAPHQAIEGYLAIGEATLLLDPRGIPIELARPLVGKRPGLRVGPEARALSARPGGAGAMTPNVDLVAPGSVDLTTPGRVALEYVRQQAAFAATFLRPVERDPAEKLPDPDYGL